MIHRTPLTLAAVLLIGLTSPTLSDDRSPALDSVLRNVAQRTQTRDGKLDVTLWVGGAQGRPWLERGSTKVMPTASAIKAFFLVELFADHADRLDQPLPDAKSILKDDHPAISHFQPAVRDEIRKELGEASVRRVADIMQGNTDVSNHVYNAAANLVTAHLGGPAKLTKRIHDRDPRFKSVMVRRYMLRDRGESGDNEATAEAFVALYQALSTRQLNGVPDSAMTAIHEVLKRKSNVGGQIYAKDGALGSEPLTSVRAGWQEAKQGPIVFVVMARHAGVAPAKRAAAYEQLSKLSADLRNEALSAARSAPAGAP